MDRRWWMALAAVALPIAVLFAPVLVTDRMFAVRDVGHFYYPLFEWCSSEWAAGRVPLWNPLENLGTPALADASSSVFYPGKLLFLLPLDFGFRFKLYVALHVVLAGFGSFVLARAWQASPCAAAVSGLSYSLSGSVLFQYSNVVFLVGAAWLPFAALAAERMLRRRDWKMAALLGLVLALMVLGGDPQAAYHALLMAGLAVFFIAPDGQADSAPTRARDAAATDDRAAEPSGEKPKRHAQLSRTTGPLQRLGAGLALLALAALEGFALSAVQVLPSAEATRLSERAAYDDPRTLWEAIGMSARPQSDDAAGPSIARGLFGMPAAGTHHAATYDFSIGPWRLVELFYPNVSGRMFPTHRRWLSQLSLEGRVWSPSLYLGLVPTLLAAWRFSLWRGSARQRWLTWLVLLFLLGSFGWYGLGWIAREVALNVAGRKLDVGPQVGGLYWLLVTLLPQYVYFRYPAKLLIVATLGLSQLAALGWDAAWTEKPGRMPRALQEIGVVSLIIGFIAWWIVPPVFSRLEHFDAALGPFDADGAVFDVLLAFFQAGSVALAAGWLLGRATSAEAATRLKWQIAALLLVAADLVVANHWLVASAPSEIWRSISPLAKAIAQSAEGSDATEPDQPPPRLFRARASSWRPPHFRETGSDDRITEIARWERATLFPKHPLPHGLALVESYGSIKLADHESLLRIARRHGVRQPGRTVLPQPTVLRLMGTSYLVLPAASEPAFASRAADDAAGPNWPDDAALWRMERTLPRAWIVHNVKVMQPLPFPHRSAAINARARDVLFPGLVARDFSRTAVIETDAPPPETDESGDAARNAAASETCRIAVYQPQRVVVEAELAAPGLVVLSDAYYPGWRATVATQQGGQTSPAQGVTILRTNRVLRGIWLPAGKHTIEYRFEPITFYWGAWISGLAWLTLAGALVGGIFKRQNPA